MPKLSIEEILIGAILSIGLVITAATSFAAFFVWH